MITKGKGGKILGRKKVTAGEVHHYYYYYFYNR